MKRFLLVLLALPFLLGACSSVTQTTAQLSDPPPAVRVADRDSAWGQRPSYDEKGQSFDLSLRNLSRNQMALDDDTPLKGTSTLDLLVNRDGTVQDATIVSSSGDRQVDDIAMALYRNARYSLRLGSDDPAPYVVNQTVVLKLSSVARDTAQHVDYGRDHHESPTYTEAYSSEAPNSVSGSPR